MAVVGAISSSIRLSSTANGGSSCYVKHPRMELAFGRRNHLEVSTFCIHLSFRKVSSPDTQFTIRAASSHSATKVKFQTSLSLPGCSSPLSLLGTGYREKVFAIIGVKVYAAGLYMNKSVLAKLDTWKGSPSADLQQDSAVFDTIFQAPLEKSLQIVLVRDVDGKTFWDALYEAISPRIKVPSPVDETALSSFRSIFQGRSLNKGTLIFLTWLDSTQLLVSVSSNGLPSTVDATIESANVTSALFDVFFGSDPVSPTLKASVSTGLSSLLK